MIFIEFLTPVVQTLWWWMNTYSLLFLILSRLMIQDIVWSYIKKWIVNKYKYVNENDPNDESYIRYYQKIQLFEFVRLVLIFWSILYWLAVYQSWFFSVFAVAIWAFILTFQTIVLSFGVYFYLMSNYRAGDTIRVGDIGQGEIIYIKPFFMSISSRNHDGEHTGELFVIPNYQVWWKPITRLDLSFNSYKKQSVTVVYDSTVMEITFDQFVEQIETFLVGYLPKISRKAYKNFKSYSGLQYKLNYELWAYKDDRHLIEVEIKFITLISSAPQHKKAIISFISDMMRKSV